VSTTKLTVSYSGGKDSTAMLHVLLDRAEDIAAVIEFRTGWEFDEMTEHRELVEQKTGLKIIPVQPAVPLDFQFAHMPIRASKDYPEEGVGKGEIRYYGYGWPSATRRWCTDIKTRGLDAVAKRVCPGGVQCIGFAADESHRCKTKSQQKMQERGRVRYPLIEAGIVESDALAMCHALGYDWSGLYEHFSRVSCFCCPLQSLPDCRALREHYPHYWQRMLAMQAACPGHDREFKRHDSVQDLDQRFATEDRAVAAGLPRRVVERKSWLARVSLFTAEQAEETTDG